MDSTNIALTSLLIAVALWASYSDFRRRLIANWLTFGTAAVALALRGLSLGLPSLLAGIEGWVVGAALLSIPFVAGWMGAGDVKLLAAFGAIGGPLFVAQTALLGCAAGGVLAVVYLARAGRLMGTLREVGRFLTLLLGLNLRSTLASSTRMPFGPALAAGAVASLLVTGVIA